MSVHVEWMDASATVAERHEAGASLPDGQQVDSVAVSFSANEVTVIDGDRADIVRLLRHALALFADGPPYTVEGCEHCAGCGEVAWECICGDEAED